MSKIFLVNSKIIAMYRIEMEALVKEGAFLEHAVFGGNMYGTSRASVAKVANQGKICILDIDMQGVKQIKQSGLKARLAVWQFS